MAAKRGHLAGARGVRVEVALPMNDEQALNRTFEIAVAMVRFAAIGLAILAGGLLALIAAIIGLLSTFIGRFGRALAERLSEAREWAARVAAMIVTGVCVVGLAGGVLAAAYWLWEAYGCVGNGCAGLRVAGGGWTGLLLALNLVGMPVSVGLMGGLNRGAALVLGLFVAGVAALAVYSPTAAIALASAFRLGGSYIVWRSLT